jgi:hypothetical protein
MKTRMGFVSNSSSSSFVMLFPEGFDVEKVDWDNLDYSVFTDYSSVTAHHPEIKEKFKNAAIEGLKKLFGRGPIGTSIEDEGPLDRGMLWDSEVVDATWAIVNLFPQYVIAEFETGPEDGKIIFIDTMKAKTALGT